MSSRRVLRAAAVTAALCTSAALALPAAALAAPRVAPAPHAGTYMLFLKSPSRSIATRADRAKVRAAQSTIASRLARMGVHVSARSLVPDTLTAKLTSSQVARVRGIRGVTHVLANTIVPMPTQAKSTIRRHRSASSTSHGIFSNGANAVCGTAAHPQLNPEALNNIDAEPAINAGFDGAGIRVAFLADGVDTTNPDFQRNAAFATPSSPTGSPVVNTVDFSGDGPTAPTSGGEAFLDASSIGAQGNTVYDLSNYVNAAHPLPVGCDIRIQGDAPGANVTSLRVFSSFTPSYNTNFVSAINYAVASGEKVINESFGSNPFPDTSLDAIRLANDAAVAAGVTVVVSSGDAGITSTIGSPSSDPNVISVGATTTFRAYQQDAYGGINVPGVGNGRVDDNNISSLSSGGFAQDGKTVDLVAPGDLNWALCTASPNFADCSSNLELTGGTSESAPLTSGAAADVIQAYASTHGGAFPSPALVKHILTSSADDISAPAEQQGAGILDVSAAVSLARSIPGTTVHHPNGGLLASTSQLDLSGQPHTTASGTVSITNTDSSPRLVVPHARQLVQRGATTGSVTLDPTATTTQPHFPIWSGIQEIYQTSTFKVPAGMDRLKFDAAYTYTGQNSLLHVALFNPDGVYEGYSLPQGLAGFADVQVANPERGRWTAVFFTEWEGGGQTGVGTSGLVPYTASFWQYHNVWDADPGILFIPPGATRNVTVQLPTGNNPGDAAASLVLGGGMSIPITLRTFVPVSATTGGTFSGVLTGGNGRSAGVGQMNTYQFKVPSGKSDLDASIAMSSNPPGGVLPADQFVGFLIDPNGQIAAMDSNYTDGTGGEEFNPYLQLYAVRPASGTWSLVVQWMQPTTGVSTSVPFTGAVRFNLVSAASTLPDSASSTVSTSGGGTYSVTVNNTGLAPMTLTTDARLPTSQVFALADYFGSPATQPLPGASNSYYVPTQTSSLGVAMTSSVPASFDVSTYTGDPDISPQTGGPFVTSTGPGTSSSITYTPPTGVAPGLWFNGDAELGPFSGPEPSGTETTTATATALAFDTSVSSSSGDVVQLLTTGAGGFSPAPIEPGQTAVITVAINPTAVVGSTVSGTLYVNGFTWGNLLPTLAGYPPLFTGQLAAIPYEYTVGS